MQRRFKAATLVIAAGFSLTLVGCGQMNKLKARKAWKEGIELYKQQDYKGAADKYKQALDLDPELTQAYFYLANSYDNQFKATKRGDAVNDGYLTKAVEYYKLAAEKDPTPAQRKLAMRFLVDDYGAEKMNDPAQEEVAIQKMIQEDPADVTNYFALAKVYDDAGEYPAEEDVLMRAKEANPKAADPYLQLANFYNKQGEFEKSIDSYRQVEQLNPNDPTIHYTIGTYFYDKAAKDRRLNEAQKRQMADEAMKELDTAIQMNPNYFEAIVYKNLTLRVYAGLEKSPAKHDELIKEAEKLLAQAQALQKKRAAGLIK